MTTKTTLSISEARKKIFEIARQVQHPNIIYTLTDKGAPKAVVMSADEFESWMETLEVMRECPDLEKEMVKANKAVKSGAYKKYKTLEGLLSDMGYGA